MGTIERPVCEACQGSGYAAIATFDGRGERCVESRKCKECDGAGIRTDCEACEGKGYVWVYRPDSEGVLRANTRKCTFCTGERPGAAVICASCRGDGYTVERIAREGGEPSWFATTCRDCEGNGLIDDKG